MGLNLDYIDGQTPLDEEEKEGLLIHTITTRGELDEFEQQNIEEALLWTLTRRLKEKEILTENFVKNLHKRLYRNVWQWAGEFRKTNKNIGVDRWQVPMELRALVDDVIFWVEHKTFSPDEIAIRFKHRIVSIHCFPNGNGRHSRLMADIIIEKIFKLPVFSWGAADLSTDNANRTTYLKAVKAADKGEFSYLLAFARS